MSKKTIALVAVTALTVVGGVAAIVWVTGSDEHGCGDRSNAHRESVAAHFDGDSNQMSEECETSFDAHLAGFSPLTDVDPGQNKGPREALAECESQAFDEIGATADEVDTEGRSYERQGVAVADGLVEFDDQRHYYSCVFAGEPIEIVEFQVWSLSDGIAHGFSSTSRGRVSSIQVFNSGCARWSPARTRVLNRSSASQP